MIHWFQDTWQRSNNWTKAGLVVGVGVVAYGVYRLGVWAYNKIR